MSGSKIKSTSDNVPTNPALGDMPVILSLRNPYPGDPTRVIRPKQGLGTSPVITPDTQPSTDVALPTSGLGAPPGALPSPTPVPGRKPAKVHVSRTKKDPKLIGGRNAEREPKPKNLN